jgi:hypothetical protein
LRSYMYNRTFMKCEINSRNGYFTACKSIARGFTWRKFIVVKARKLYIQKSIQRPSFSSILITVVLCGIIAEKVYGISFKNCRIE